MAVKTLAPFFSLLFLCGQQAAQLSPRARCADNLCAFQVSVDFRAAAQSCEDSGGQLFSPVPGQDAAILAPLLSGFSGRLWLQSGGRGAAHGGQRCPAVSATEAVDTAEPCTHPLDGFVCRYGPEDVCRPLQPPGDARVSYTTAAGFDVSDSDTFPPGTMAEVATVAGPHPDSKHLCFSASWFRAPWSCEVLGGGCEHGCAPSPESTCTCPAGRVLHANNITCTCEDGSRPAGDGQSCVEVDACAEEDPCAEEGKECVNTPGGRVCMCPLGFMEEDGECLDATVCALCEHSCVKGEKEYRCACHEGYVVWDQDPSRCLCVDCPARCERNDEVMDVSQLGCYCPDGYIKDFRNDTVLCTDINECDFGQCEQLCENHLGGFTCLCTDGFVLVDEYLCVPLEEGSGGLPPGSSTPASPHRDTLPSYIKTGSVLGISVFVVLVLGLLYFLGRKWTKRCGKLELSSLKHPDIFYLQQVTTETYKRLSFDKQSKNNSHRL
ncbi:thrombomodulin-like [Pholidichthys leucotaenia]